MTIDTSNPSYKHGGAGRSEKHPLYNTWCGIIDRCYNPKSARFADYGGRGISLFAPWRHDFAAFAAYLGNRPKGCSLDRINNDLGYQPGNLRWASNLEQSRNRRNRRRWEWGGENLMLSEWVEVLEMDFDALRARLDTYQTLVSQTPEIYRTRVKGNKTEIYSRTNKRYLGSLPLSCDENDILEFLRVAGGRSE